MVEIKPFVVEENEYEILDLILKIQIGEFNVPITADDQPDLLDISNFYQKGCGNFWLAKYRNEIIGTIALIDCGNDIGTIRKMFVKKEFRGKEYQVAQNLYNILEESAINASISNLYLGTIERLQAAIRFYERNGFSIINKTELPEEFPIMKVDTLFFKKKIG